MKGSAFIKLSTEADTSYEDIFSVYGVSFIKGAYMKLLNYAKAKSYVKNESRLENGTQYLASATYSKVEEKSVTVNILLEGSSVSDFITKYEAFTQRISKGIFYLKIPSKYRVLKLVYSNIQEQNEYRNNYATFALTLVEPNPCDRIKLDSSGNVIQNI